MADQIDEIIRPLTVDGLRYAYRVLPQPQAVTEPVLVFGGALQGMFGWPQMEDRLLPAASVVTADLPGMGEASQFPPGRSVETLHTAISQIIDDLGAPRVNLFGYSYGAVLAYCQAQRAPHRIARLLIGGVPPALRTEETRDALRRAAGQLTAGHAQEFATEAADSLFCLDKRRVVRHRHLAYRYVRRSLLHAALHSPHAVNMLLHAVDTELLPSGGLSGVPTLVFAGEHDTVNSPEDQREFASDIDGSRFVSITDSDHWVVLERAAEVADLALRFFTDRPLTPAEYLTEHPPPALGTAPGHAETPPKIRGG
jgi:pimeloyl-ACP methyl ester carboxylesterase